MTKWKKFKRLRRRTMFHLLRWLAVAVSYAGFERLKPLGRALGSLQYRLGHRQRQHLLAVIPQALDKPANPASILRTAYRENTRAVLEILAMYSRRLPDSVLEAACEIEGLEQLDTLERGAILLGTHSGNGVLLPLRLARMGYYVCTAMREANKIPPGFYQQGLARYGVQALDAAGGGASLKAMIRALRNGALLYILVDQGSKHHGVTVDFLGRETRIPAGPAVLARRCGVPIIPAPTVAAEPAWRFRLDAPLALAHGGNKESDTCFTARLTEQQIRAHPELWTWHHRRWGRTG